MIRTALQINHEGESYEGEHRRIGASTEATAVKASNTIASIATTTTTTLCTRQNVRVLNKKQEQDDLQIKNRWHASFHLS